MTRTWMVDQKFSFPPRRDRRGAGPPMRFRLGVAVAAVVALAAAAGPATAALYKWVDADGHVVYSDQPPPASIKSEIVKPPPPPANPNAAAELQEKALAIKQRDMKLAEEAQAAEKARQASQQRREACVNALGQMKALQQRDETLVRYNEKGEKVPFDDQMRREAFERQQQIARDNCPG